MEKHSKGFGSEAVKRPMAVLNRHSVLEESPAEGKGSISYKVNLPRSEERWLEEV